MTSRVDSKGLAAGASGWWKEMVRPSAQQFKAMLLSVSLLAVGLLTLWLGQWVSVTQPEQLSVREIALASPPPPPPPPPSVVQLVQQATVSVQIPGAGPSLTMLEIAPRLDIKKPSEPVIESQPSQWQSLDIDWDAFALNDLDGFPSLLTPLRVNFPKSLSRRGVKHVLIKLDVMIDEVGQVTLIDVVENAYPELASEIQRLVRQSRFTAPQKDGEPVRARFVWPIEITP